MSEHAIVHIEFPAKSPQAGAEFYQKLFGWKIENAMPEMDYWTFEPKEGPGGGFPAIDGEAVNSGDVTIYVATDDIEASLARAEELGGKTLVPKSEIPGTGWFAILGDPSGNKVGLYTGLQE